MDHRAGKSKGGVPVSPGAAGPGSRKSSMTGSAALAMSAAGEAAAADEATLEAFMNGPFMQWVRIF